MAQAIRYACTDCQRTVVAWSDGNPYYIDEAGKKRYAYHPDHKRLARCIGNDSPHLCLACGAEVSVDSRMPTTACPGCGAEKLVRTYNLESRQCPSCQRGTFISDPSFRLIS